VRVNLPFVTANGDGAIGLLGDPSRRAIFELLARRPSSVGEIAEQLPISRPAVSQHLKVLRDGGLVASRAEGNRRVHSLDPRGVAALRTWLDGVWEHALADFQKFADQVVADEAAGTDHPAQEQP
jgi:DNA-binding transcriptional ArsR family regulator